MDSVAYPGAGETSRLSPYPFPLVRFADRPLRGRGQKF
jgi:hypothetical protein